MTESLWSWMYARPQEASSAWTVVLWWEKRRFAYNLLLGTVGLCSLLLFHIFVERSGALPPGEDAGEPIMLILAPFIANLCYTAGWLVELIARRFTTTPADLGPRLLKLGVVFSLAVAMLPTIIWAGIYVGSLFGLEL
jgi:hypothetical protein